MKSFFLILFLLAAHISSALAAASGTIRGKITDTNASPLEYVVVTLLKTADSSLVKGAITGADGSYNFENISPGNYIIAASLSGYNKTWTSPFELQTNVVDVPDLQLANHEQEAVTIVSAQPLLVQKAGMIIMNVENSPVRIIGSAFDLIGQAPGVLIDQNGNINLKGKAGVTVYIDGKNTYLSGEQLKNFLQNIPAQNVVRLEIISNPSAKYDAQGNSGIINIITQKGNAQGFNGSVYSAAGSGELFRTNDGFSFNYGKAKSNIYGKYDFGSTGRMHRHHTTKNVPYAGQITRFDQDNVLHYRPYSHNLRLGVDFNPNAQTSWGIQANGMRDVANIKSENYSEILETDSGNLQTLDQYNKLRGRFSNASTGIYFVHQLDTNGTEISASTDYLVYYNRTNEWYDLQLRNQEGEPDGPLFRQRSRSGSDIHIYAGQADFTHPFGKKYKIETGIKGSYVENKSDIAFEIENNSNWENDPSRTNLFTYKEQISAAYVNLSYTGKTIELMGGLRAERTFSDGISPSTGQELRQSYTELFPSLFLTHKISEKHTLNYSVSRRINRPSYEDLNPFLYYIDRFSYKAGNPFLQPEFTWIGEIGYSFNNFLFINGNYSRTDESMTDVSEQVDSTGIIYQTILNLDKMEMAVLDISVSKQITRWWISEASISFAYTRNQSELFGSSFDRSATTMNFSGTETFLLPGNWKFQVSGWYKGGTYYGFSYFNPSGTVDLAISRNFLNKKLQCSLNVTDIFHTRQLRITSNYLSQDIQSKMIPDSRSVMLRMRYNFGNAKAARKSEFKSSADDLKKRA